MFNFPLSRYRVTTIFVLTIVFCSNWALAEGAENEVRTRKCLTRDDLPGECMPIELCHSIYSYYESFIKSTKPIPRRIRTKLNSLSCINRSGNKIIVCCLSKVSKYLDFEDPPDISMHENLKLLPYDDCGKASSRFRIRNGKNTELGDFPWMAIIFIREGESGRKRFKTVEKQVKQMKNEGKQKNGPALHAPRTEDGFGCERNPGCKMCGGTIINERYILTAAHCVTKTKPTSIYVRVGEHDLSREKDCVPYWCAPPVQDLSVEEIIIHQKYRRGEFHDDIAMLRVSKMNFKDTVLPICLPIDQVSKKQEVKSLTATGWGVNHTNAPFLDSVVGQSSCIALRDVIMIERQELIGVCLSKRQNTYSAHPTLVKPLPRGRFVGFQVRSLAPSLGLTKANSTSTPPALPFIMIMVLSSETCSIVCSLSY
ncbi:unnamed protein product [Phaedon cochleariae]|uniref:CLIP domain-containing serine protease n=1 Tax=Phaedon cochleariae TaxID=80249 RepID=A0A9P0DD61_PHACE|nr:unnamed protein product [Phaedon cochleariae]